MSSSISLTSNVVVGVAAREAGRLASNFCADHLWPSEAAEKKLWRDFGFDFVGEAEGARVAEAAARERVVLGRDERVTGSG